MRIGEFVSRTFSIVLQPLLMPFYNVLLLFTYTTFFQDFRGQTLRFLIPVFIFSFIVPSTFIGVLRRLGIVNDFSLYDRRERYLPYLMACFSNLVLLYFFYSANLYIWFLGLIAVPIVILLLALLITPIWKISPYMMGIGGVIGSVLTVSYYIKQINPFVVFSVLFILAGCLAVSRLHLKKDTPSQIYGGFILGICGGFFTIWGSIYFMYRIMSIL